jgi:hypothetical protein
VLANDKLKAQAQESPWTTTLQQCTFFSKSHYIFCPSDHNGSNGPHLKHGKRKFYLCLHHDHQLVLSFLASFQDLVFMAIRNEVQRFGSALLITIANTSLLKGEKKFILRWWNQTTKAMTTNFYTGYKVQGQ